MRGSQHKGESLLLALKMEEAMWQGVQWLQLTTSKNTVTSVLQPQGIELGQQQE